MLFNRIVTERILFLGASIVTEILVGLLAASLAASLAYHGDDWTLVFGEGDVVSPSFGDSCKYS